jgi:hypothetical protein
VIKLQAMCKKAEGLLTEINSAMINATMDIVIKNKPIFDEEKKKLFTIQAALDKQYSQGLLVRQDNSVIVQVRLCDTTEFPAWNYLAVELNSAADELDGIDNSNSSAGKEKPSEFSSLMRRFGRTMVLVITGMLVVVVLFEYVVSMQRLYGEFREEVFHVSSTAHFDAVHEAADSTPVLVNWMSSHDKGPWSEKLEQDWNMFAIKAAAHKKSFHVMKVDCAFTADVCEREKITSFPTLQMYRGSNLEVDFGPVQDEQSLQCVRELFATKPKLFAKEETVDAYAKCVETAGAAVSQERSEKQYEPPQTIRMSELPDDRKPGGKPSFKHPHRAGGGHGGGGGAGPAAGGGKRKKLRGHPQ